MEYVWRGWMIADLFAYLMIINPVLYSQTKISNEYTNRAIRAYIERDYKLAEKKFIHAIEEDSSNENAYHNLFILYLEMKQFDRALHFNDECLKKFPESVNVRIDRGFYYTYQRQFDSTIVYFNKFLLDYPDHYKALYQIGNAYAANGDFESAKRYFHKAIESNKYFGEAYGTLVDLYFNEQKHDSARILLTRGFEFDSTDFQLLRYKAIYMGWNKEYDAAIEVLKRAFDLADRNREWIKRDIGLLYWEQKKFPEAIKSFNEALAINPKFEPAYFHLARLYNSLGNIDKARRYMPLLVDSKNPDYCALANINLGDAALSRGEFVKARKHFMKALKVKGDDAEFLTRIGETFNREKKYDEAVKYYKKAVTVNPLFVRAYLALAGISIKLGKTQEADQYFQKAAKLGDESAKEYLKSKKDKRKK